jgi:VanZ family protein
MLSAWPFNLRFELVTEPAWETFIGSLGWRSTRGNIGGNVLLFLPAGLLAAGAVARMRAVHALSALAAMGATTLALAVTIQALQLALPGRDASLVDAVWNTAGFVLGALGASLLAIVSAGIIPAWRGLKPLPIALVAAWISYRLAPFVPTFDAEAIRTNLAPLLDPTLSVGAVISNAAAWLAVIFLLDDATTGRPRALAITVFVAAVIVAETLVVGRNGVKAACVAGAVIAILIWYGRVRNMHRPAVWVWGCVATGIAFAGLWPVAVSGDAVRPFFWYPFIGVLYGDMWLNTLALTWKAFAYGTLVYAGWRAWHSWALSAVAGIALTFSIEWLQPFYQGHVPEITDPLLVLLAALAGRAVAGRAVAGRPAG